MSANVRVHRNPISIKTVKMMSSEAESEFDRRRQIRLQQVRQQSKEIAAEVRNRVRKEKVTQCSKAEEAGENCLKRWQTRKLMKLQQQYEYCLREMGMGHANAALEPDPCEELKEITARILTNAEIRGKKAVEQKRNEDKQKKYQLNERLERKRAVKQYEEARALMVATLHCIQPTVISKKKEISKYKEGIRKKEVHKKEVSKKEISKKEVSKTEIFKKELSKKEVPKQEDFKKEVPKKDISKKEVSKKENYGKEDPKKEDSKKEVPKKDVSKKEVSKKDVSKKEDSKKEDYGREGPKKEDCKKEVPKKEDYGKEVPKKKVLKEEVSGEEVPKKEYFKKQAPKRHTMHINISSPESCATEEFSFIENLDFPDIMIGGYFEYPSFRTKLADRIRERDFQLPTVKHTKDISVGNVDVIRPTLDNIRKSFTNRSSNDVCSQYTCKHCLNRRHTQNEKISQIETNGASDEQYYSKKIFYDIIKRSLQIENHKICEIPSKQLPFVPKTTVHATINTNQPSKVNYYDLANRFRKQYIAEPLIQKISKDSIEVHPLSERNEQYTMYKTMQERNKKAYSRGIQAMEKEKIKKNYMQLMEDLPVMQRQERLASMQTHNPSFHMCEERLQALERRRQSRIENIFEKYYQKAKLLETPMITIRPFNKQQIY